MGGMRIFLVTLLAGLTAFGAQRDDATWAKVEHLRPGQAVRVLCSDQRTWTGSLVGVAAESLTLKAGGAERQIARSDVLRADVKTRMRSALIGLGLGAAAGVGVGYAAGSASNLKSSEKTTAVGLGALLVAPAGAAIGAMFPGWRTVYRVAVTESAHPAGLKKAPGNQMAGAVSAREEAAR